MCTDITKAKWVSSLVAPPPAPGWWAASYVPDTYKMGYRKNTVGFSWYDNGWSCLYFSKEFYYTEENGYSVRDTQIPDVLEMRRSGPKLPLFYCDYWPENPRVPRPFKTEFKNERYICI